MDSLIKQISETNAVSGCEDKIREIILENIQADEITTDSMGNIIAHKNGSGRRLVVTAHMDEAGFIVSSITDKGYIKFRPVGDIDINTVISKRVVVGEDVKGIIGMKAIHLQTREERQNTVPAKNLFIDIGAKSKKSAQKRVKIGDYITFDTEFFETDGKICGKALSRMGVYAVMKAMDAVTDADVYYVFTAQKEVGMRGAEIISERLAADAVITVGTAVADDTFGCGDEKSISLGAGAVIGVTDAHAIYDKSLTEKIISAAEESGIPYVKAAVHGFSDGGAMITNAGGAACANISIPCRYAKTPSEMMAKSDIEAAARLLKELLGRWNQWNY